MKSHGLGQKCTKHIHDKKHVPKLDKEILKLNNKKPPTN